jgi:hypothetical protein
MRGFLPLIEDAQENGATVYKTAALPTELIRLSADFLDFCQGAVNRERAEGAAEA